MPNLTAVLLLLGCYPNSQVQRTKLEPCQIDPEFDQLFWGTQEDASKVLPVLKDLCPEETYNVLFDVLVDLKPSLDFIVELREDAAAVNARRVRATAALARYCSASELCELPWASKHAPSRNARAAGKLLHDAIVDRGGPTLAEKVTRAVLDAAFEHTTSAGLSHHLLGHRVPTSSLFSTPTYEVLRIVDLNLHPLFPHTVPQLYPRAEDMKQDQHTNVIIGVQPSTPLSALPKRTGAGPIPALLVARTPPASEAQDFIVTAENTHIRLVEPSCAEYQLQSDLRLIGTSDSLSFRGQPFGPELRDMIVGIACQSEKETPHIVVQAGPDLQIVTALRHLEAASTWTFKSETCPDGATVTFQRPCIQLVAPD